MLRRITASLPCVLAAVSIAGSPAAGADRSAKLSPAGLYAAEAEARAAGEAASRTPGSVWSAGAPLADLARDLKASQIDDLVTILVSDQASAYAKADTKASRKSAARYSVSAAVSAAGGLTRAGGPWPNLAGASGGYELDGQGATTRDTAISTTLSARVTRVLPNGYLVLEGTKNVAVNSEVQVVSVRGVVRPFDVSPGNLVRSDRMAQLEVKVNGKGVVGDAVRRPFFLYRILLGLLPF